MRSYLLRRSLGNLLFQLGTAHANADEEAQMVLEAAGALLSPVQSLCRPLSPVIGAHVGPGTVALAYMTGFG